MNALVLLAALSAAPCEGPQCAVCDAPALQGSETSCQADRLPARLLRPLRAVPSRVLARQPVRSMIQRRPLRGLVRRIPRCRRCG